MSSTMKLIHPKNIFSGTEARFLFQAVYVHVLFLRLELVLIFFYFVHAYLQSIAVCPQAWTKEVTTDWLPCKEQHS